MMRRLLIALTALVLLGGVAGGAMAQNTAKGGSTAQASPDNEQNPEGQLPGCNPSEQQPNKCPGGGAGGGGGGGGGGPVAGNCEDGLDNEPGGGDGFTDGDDPDCQKPGCKPSSQTPNKCNETTDNSKCGIGNDHDGDGDCDNADNCPNVANPGQEDSDNDGIGDACEACVNAGGDSDGDGVCNNTDNCDNVANPGQADTDGDGIGDACEPVVTLNKCTAATADPGILTDDTLGQTLWDGGLSALAPLTEDPEADGPLSGAIYGAGNGTQLEPLTDEGACLIDLLLQAPPLPDL